MSKEVITPVKRAKVDTEADFSKVNPRRGNGYNDMAVAFIKEFPIGEQLTQEEFCIWATEQGFLKMPPKESRKDSDLWMAHLQRRHQLRYNINKAATHPRLIGQGISPFTIENIGGSTLQVRSVQAAISNSNIGGKVLTVCDTKRKQLVHWMRGVDRTKVRPEDWMMVEIIYMAIADFEQRINLDVNMLADKFAKLQSRLDQAGVGIPQLPAPSEDDIDGD